MATFSKANDWVEYLVEGVNLGSDNFSVALSNTAPASESSNPLSSGNGVLANVTQISYANYTDDLTVDRRLESVTSAESGGTLTFDAGNFVITASGGALADWRYLYIYDDTVTGDPIIGVWDQGSTVSLVDTQNANVNVNASGIFTLT